MDTTKNAIEVTNLVKRYKELVALDHFNLTVKTGEIFGLLGPNGSGKTTTINCILSLLTYDKGDIKVFGQEMYSNSYDIKREIGVVMQNVAVYDELTVYENIDYFCGLYVSDKKLREKICKGSNGFRGHSGLQQISAKEALRRTFETSQHRVWHSTQAKAHLLR